MLRDAEFFRARLSKLEGAGDIGDYVVSVVKERLEPALNNNTPGAPAVQQTTEAKDGAGETKT